MTHHSTKSSPSRKQLLREISHLRQRLGEVEGTPSAVREPGANALACPEHGGNLITELEDSLAALRDLQVQQQALQESEEKYRRLVQMARCSILRFDMAGRVTLFNEYAQEFFGYTEAEIVGRPVVDTILAHTESTGRDLAAMLEGIIHHPERFAYNENENIRKDGERVWMAWTNGVIRGPEGEITEILSIGMDITERKRMEEALRRSEEEFHATFELAGCGMSDVKLTTGRFLHANLKFCEITGYTNRELRNLSPLDITHPDDRQSSEANLQRVAFGEISEHTSEKRYIRKDGQVVWVLVTAATIHDGNGCPDRLIAVVQDIGDRRRAEEALQDTAAELGRSNRDLEQFAYIASHDLQEPLRMIVGYLQLLERRYKDQIDKSANEFIEFAVDGATRMQNLITDLLAYSRVGTQVQTLVDVDLQTILDRCMANLRSAIQDSGATITWDPLPTIRADGSQMLQLLQNLLSNAIKFRGDSPPRIHVSARKHQGRWLFSVADNGIGVDPQCTDKIFVIFQRLHGRDKYPGTGIGLAICKKIVERHGGRIWVDSQPGRGSTFYFTL